VSLKEDLAVDPERGKKVLQRVKQAKLTGHLQAVTWLVERLPEST